MLHAIAELAEDVVRHVVGELRTEVHADALGADDAHDLFDALLQGGRRVIEEQVRFVEHEHQLGLVEVADFRQLLEQFRQQPQQERRIQARLQDQLLRRQDVDHAAAIGGGAHQVGKFQRGLAKEHLAAFLLQAQQRALDRADRLRADQAIRGGDVLAFLGDQAEQGAQVLEIEQQQATVVGELEDDVEDAALGVVEFQDAREQGRTHLADRGAHRVPVLAKQIPEHDRVGFVCVIGDADVLDPRLQLVAGRTGHGEAGDVALHIGEEHRHAHAREAFRDGHQRDRLARAGGTGDEAVAIAQAPLQEDLAVGFRQGIRGGDRLADQDRVAGKHVVCHGWGRRVGCRDSMPAPNFPSGPNTNSGS